MNQKILIKLVSLLSLVFSSQAFSNSVFQFEVEGKNKTRQGLATKINDSTFITDAELVDNGGKIYLINASVTPATKVLAELKYINEKARVALLVAGGLPGDAITFAKEPLTLGRSVKLLTPQQSMNGTVVKFGAIEDMPKGHQFYTHQMLYQKTQWAAPIVNNCDEFVGMSMAMMGTFSGMEAPEEFAFALNSQSVVDVLNEHKVKFSQASVTCLSEKEQLEAKAKEIAEQAQKIENDKLALEKKLQEEADAKAKLEAKLKAEAEAKTKAQQQTEIIKKQASDTKKAADDELKKRDKKADDTVKKIKEENAKKKAEAEKRQLIIYIASGVVLLVLLIFTFIVLSKRKKTIREKEAQIKAKQAQVHETAQQASHLEAQKQELKQELEHFKKSFCDVMFDGVDSAGTPIKLKINGTVLAQKGSQLLGRDGNSVDYLIADQEVSRQHLKLSIEGELLMVEDLGSHNGTFINGQQAKQGQKVALPDGSELVLSNGKLRVQYLK